MNAMINLHLCLPILLLLLLVNQSLGLTTDGVLLLSFKYSVLNDPLGVLDNWSYSDESPCSWNGVFCGGSGDPVADHRVTGVSLPNSKLGASIPANLGLIQHLMKLDLSNNSINGSIPLSLYNATELKFLDFSNNLISGELRELVRGWKSLQFLNISGNLLNGKVPESLAGLSNLTVVSLKDNYFHGNLPNGFDSVRFLDLSANFINGSLPSDFGSGDLVFFNVSHNNISGEIPPEFTNKISTNATIDLSFNNLTGAIPESSIFFNQDKRSFAGNYGLCGKPLTNLCLIPSSVSKPPNVSSPATSPPAIAAIPKTADSSSSNSSNTRSASSKPGFKTTTIVGIVVGDIAGIAVLATIFIYILKKRKKDASNSNQKHDNNGGNKEYDWASSSEDQERKWLRSWACLIKRRVTEDEESSTQSTTSESEETELTVAPHRKNDNSTAKEVEKKGELVTVDGGDKKLELETLLKASAYILGATGSSIIYKAVLEDGTALAVRRIGESGLERFRDFENQVRVIAKLIHPNLVRIRGFYWGADEKLVIYDFIPHGSLANARYRKVGSSPCPLPWDVRLRIAKGTARGLMYIHDKKQVHGNLKPSNILLGSDMEPKIGDFGLERLVVGENSCKVGGSSRNFGSKRSTASRDSFQDVLVGSNPSPSPSAMGCISPYYAPESLRSLKPNAKWDVFSYGVVLLELLTGKVIVSDEFGPASMTWSSILTDEEKNKVLRMADVAIRGEMEGKEEALLAILRLGYNCISPVPQKRPHMKEVIHALDKFPPAASSSAAYYYGHL
ncbi:probable LRR receptor-like serine/threonine-protein kinase At4g37250 [Cynara cardunculus var. scolymus]|uniref:Leucine-rich repeat-containing protein n=1 Tax=Cynara cardunculus var. scolymus TaxID=59895 RepID=A0A103XKK2_CYNCS|nr:probable LRR receptor-like serine/threonine-protein kinase At4g37250 [Cynara cardunculus var. scolymus]KVH92481.1 Leucine-rich repeat-containing protein [Cynara cardunculus var. scolymus]